MAAIATPIHSASVLAKTFWQLAGDEPDVEDPVEIALCAARALEALERTDRPKVTASTLSFLLRLESDRIYASPEQARGDTTNQRSLVFTVGVLVFEKLTGYHPFGAISSRPSTNEAVDEVVPPELRAVLETAMAPFPADRWSSLRALRDELHRFVGNEGTLVAEAPRFRPRTVPPPCPGSAVRRVVGSRPSTLPEPPARAASVPPPRAASVPPPLPELEPPLVDVSLLEEPRRSAGIARGILLMVCGAALALAAMWSMDSDGALEPAPATPTELPALIVDTAPEPEPAPAIAPEPEPEPEPEPAPEPAAFSPDAGGETALAAMRGCFDDARLTRGVELGASLRFTAADGASDRVYYAPAQQLTDAERSCVRDRLTGISAGAAPERTTIVSYTFWLAPERARFRAQTRR